MDIKTRRDASRGRKSKAGGGKNQKRLKNIHPCFKDNKKIIKALTKTMKSRKFCV